MFAPAATAASISAPAPASVVSAEATFVATKPFGWPCSSNADESDTVCVVTSLPPRDSSASMHLLASPSRSPGGRRGAVAARDSTPAEICARSGTAVTTPVPVTVTVSVVGAGSTALAPSGRRTPASAAATSTSPAANAIRFMG